MLAASPPQHGRPGADEWAAARERNAEGAGGSAPFVQVIAMTWEDRVGTYAHVAQTNAIARQCKGSNAVRAMAVKSPFDFGPD